MSDSILSEFFIWKDQFEMKKKKSVLLLLFAILMIGIGSFGTLTLIKIGIINAGSKQTVVLGVEGSVNDLGQLSTAEYVYSLTVNPKKEGKKLFNKIKLPFTESEALFSYDGTLKAGIDFNKVKIKSKSGGKEFIVSIPSVEIFSNELDNDSFKKYDEKEGLFNKIKMEDFNDWQKTCKENAEEKAISNGILKIAEENAQEIIEKMIVSAYGKDCKVSFN